MATDWANYRPSLILTQLRGQELDIYLTGPKIVIQPQRQA